MFSKNLDFLMELTGTQASALGRACLLDASYVSRLRSGARALPKRPVFLRDMSRYLARRVTADYQRGVLCEALKLSAWPADEETGAELIEKWLVGEESVPDLAPFLASFAGPGGENAAAPGERPALPKPRSYYYGPEGKREAVLQFFDLILRERTPQTLLLFSEEEMSWLYEDPAFAAQWSQAFRAVLAAGNRVRIIHSVGRNMNEMLEAVAKWIPIYMTGMIEPYYYPRLRDGVFQRTLFLAPRTAAVASASVDRRTEGMLNELVTDRDAVAALTMEYERYFSLCRPLMRILTAARREELWQACGALMSAAGDMVCMSDMPTLATMPEQVARAMQERAPESCIWEQWRTMREFVGSLAGEGAYTELLSPEPAESETPLLPCGELLGAPGLRYTPEEWQAHRENLVPFAAAHSAYRQRRLSGIPGNICLFVKEGLGAVMLHGRAPGVAFAFSEPSVVSSFWSYLTRLL